jgi:hypothetical protein
VRCGRCGSENSEGNRFCGMCGASLVAKAQAPVAPPAVTPPPTRQPVDPEVRPPQAGRLPARLVDNNLQAPPPVSRPIASSNTDRPSEPVVTPSSVNSSIYSSTNQAAPVKDLPSSEPANDSSPMMTPSFLGLGDARGRSSSNQSSVDYLLEDDDEPKRGWGKAILVLIALALIGGFGYLRWKQGGFNFLRPAPTAQSEAAPQDSAATGPATDTNTKPATPETAAPTPANSDTASPTSTGTGANTAPPDTAAPAAGTATSPSGTDATAQPGTNPPVPPASVAPTDKSAPAKAQEKPSENSTDSDSADDEAAPAKPAPAPVKRSAAKPSPTRTREPKPSAATPADITNEAERYIYGRSIPQDCERGLRMLKPAADQANPKAMIALGTLYSSGTCTPRDLPTAYRWFARALHKQPDNPVLQNDLQKLWSQMTQPERQLAIKLSQ